MAVQTTEYRSTVHAPAEPQGCGCGVSAVLPAYNEEAVIERTVRHIAEVVGVLPILERGADLAIGRRRQRSDPPMRLFNARSWKLRVNELFGYTARDVDRAFNLFRVRCGRALPSMPAERRSAPSFWSRRDGWASRSLEVTELPVSHFPRTAGSATGARPAVIAQAFKEPIELERVRDSAA